MSRVAGLLLAASIAVILQAPSAVAEGKPAAASAWEYRVLTRDQLLELGKKDLVAGLNRLGEEGWELVALEPAETRSGQTPQPAQYYFKRPAAKKPAPASAFRAEIKLYTLRNADAVRLAPILQEVFYKRTQVPLNAVPDARTNSILVTANSEDQRTVEALITRLDVPAVRPEPKKP